MHSHIIHKDILLLNVQQIYVLTYLPIWLFDSFMQRTFILSKICFWFWHIVHKDTLFLHVDLFDALKDFPLKQNDDHIVRNLNKAELKMNPLAWPPLSMSTNQLNKI